MGWQRQAWQLCSFHGTSVTSIAGSYKPASSQVGFSMQACTILLVLVSCSNDQIGVQNTIGAINAVTIFLGALYSLNVSRHSMLREGA